MNMSEMKCGNCGKVYTVDQFVRLQSIKLIEEDTNPTEQYGYTSVCECGYRFSIDRWRLHDIIKIGTEKGDIDVQVSTAFLESNHAWKEGEEIWYETMIFPQVEWLGCGFQNRYKTKEEAIEYHNRILDTLKTGKYKIIKIKDYFEDKDNMELVIDDSEDKYDAIYAFTKALRLWLSIDKKEE